VVVLSVVVTAVTKPNLCANMMAANAQPSSLGDAIMSDLAIWVLFLVMFPWLSLPVVLLAPVIGFIFDVRRLRQEEVDL
jgi:hypothetical protein